MVALIPFLARRIVTGEIGSSMMTVIHTVSAAFGDGYNVGILGANGAGKSTLIRLLAATEMPDSGQVHRDCRVSFPLGYGGTFHGALSRYSGADGTDARCLRSAYVV